MTPAEIVERIQETLRRHGSVPVPSAGLDGSLGPDFATLESQGDIYSAPLTGNRRVVGRVTTFVKRALRRLLSPVLARQVAYNLANTRVLTRIKDEIDTIALRQDDVWARLEQLAAASDALREELVRIHAQETSRVIERIDRDRHALLDLIGGERGMKKIEADLDWLRSVTQATAEQAARTDRRLRRLLYQESGDASAGPTSSAPRRPPGPIESEFDYFGFEMRFRGTEHEIKRRQTQYVDCFRNAENVLDIGCGRGEFLELLRDAGIAARGVDMDLDMVLACREKGLDVMHADAFGHLETLADESLGGVFASQLIEHLEPARMMELIRLCHRKLRAGKTIVLETINPQCPAGMNAFYLDPSHVRPVHPDMLRFFLESIQFADTTIRYSLDAGDGFDVDAMTDEWRRTNCPDYAAIARK